MKLKNTLRTGLTICTLAGASLMAKPAEGIAMAGWIAIAMEGEGEECYRRVYDPLVHIVEGNENLWDIGRLYFGKVAERNETGKIIRHYPTEIATANHIKTSDYIHPGQSLVIPGMLSDTYHCSGL